MEALDLLIYPFLACVMLILIHAYYGVHILERGIIFVDLSLAQFIGLGIALSFLFPLHDDGWTRNLFAGAFAVAGAMLLAFSRRLKKAVNIEAFIGVLYVFSFASSILVLDRTPHGLEEFKTILNGNILWVTSAELFTTFIVYSGVGTFLMVFRKRFSSLSFEGKGGAVWDFLFFLSFAVVLVKSVQMVGILQVFAFLIIPALIGRLIAGTAYGALAAGWLIGLAASLLGVTLSYRLDVPTAPLIVVCLSATFFILLGVKVIKGR